MKVMKVLINKNVLLLTGFTIFKNKINDKRDYDLELRSEYVSIRFVIDIKFNNEVNFCVKTQKKLK